MRTTAGSGGAEAEEAEEAEEEEEEAVVVGSLMTVRYSSLRWDVGPVE